MENLSIPLNQLVVFKKNTDAAASIKGFEYQKLKTLDAWLSTVHERENKIFCEYEDDIMQLNPAKSTVKFHQIKLYASQFSLKSAPIKKSISNFFLLFCNPVYRGQNTQFIFESNSSLYQSEILLSEWVNHQGGISEQLLDEIRPVVTQILSEFIVEQKNAQLLTIDRKRNTLNAAKARATDDEVTKRIENQLDELGWQHSNYIDIANQFEQIEAGIIEEFIQSIRWEFQDQAPEDAFNELVYQIENKILSLPYGIIRTEVASLFTRLYYGVTKATINELASDRLLTFANLEHCILTRQEGDDQWYFETKHQWEGIVVTSFRIVEFYEVVQACHYCRSKVYLHHDDRFWVDLLYQYLSLDQTPDFSKRKGAYEICLLLIKPDLARLGIESGTYLNEHAVLIRTYFSNIEQYSTISDLEDALVLILMGLRELRNPDSIFTEEEWNDWLARLFSFLDNQINTVSVDYRCGLLECRAHLSFFINMRDDPIGSTRRYINELQEIIHYLPEAPQYSLFQLFERVKDQVNALKNIVPELELDALLDLTEQLNELFSDRENDYSRAKGYVDQSLLYLKAGKVIKAINLLHKSKDLWQKEEYADGYILACLNIAQFYQVLRMNLAAKQYAMSVCWYVGWKNDPQLIHRYAHGLQLVTLADFSQGAWISFLDNFSLAINAFLEFDKNALVPDDEHREPSRLIKLLTNGLIVNYLGERFAPELLHLIEYKLKLDGESDDSLLINQIKKLIENRYRDFTDSKFLEEVEGRHVIDSPFNDLGASRSIRWAAYESEWTIEFKNDYLTNQVAEQLAALLQILQVEFLNDDFYFIRASVFIQLIISTQKDNFSFEQNPSNDIISWQVTVPTLQTIDRNNNDEVNEFHRQCVSLAFSLLTSISLLPSKVTGKFLFEHMQHTNLAKKTLGVHLYERTYQKLVNQGSFEETQRQSFLKPTLYKTFVITNPLELPWNGTISPHYNKNEVLARITEDYRYINTILFPSLLEWTNVHPAKPLLEFLNAPNFLDWQLYMAIIYNHKSQIKLRQFAPFANKSERNRAFIYVFNKIIAEGKPSGFVILPNELVVDQDLLFWLKQIPVLYLEQYGLTFHGNAPNSDGILEVLSSRFNFLSDDIDYRSLLQ